jgi:hypothetical protein
LANTFRGFLIGVLYTLEIKVRKSTHPQQQIFKFLRCGSPQIENPQFFMIYSQSEILKFLQNSAQLCLKTVLKVAFLKRFLFCTLKESIICYVICKEKMYVFADLRPQITKRLGPQIANPQSATFAESLQIQQIIKVHKSEDLRFAKFICGPSTFD